MKQSLLIAVLGVTLVLGTPSLVFADNVYIFKGGTLEQYGHAKHKHHNYKNKHKRFVAKPPKPYRNHKHKNRVRQFVKNHHHNKPSLSISWNVGDSSISYANDNYAYNNDYRHKHNYKKHRGKRIYKRLERQRNRIHRGVRSGQLVKREARKLRREQRHIKETLTHYKRDGHLNRYERAKLQQLLDVASNHIQRKMNNRLTRYSQQHNNYDYGYGYVQY